MRRILRHPATMIGSDGLPSDPRPIRACGEPFRECSAATAAKKSSFRCLGRAQDDRLPAQRFSLEGRGLIREGIPADLVLFDPTRFIDTATFTDPCRPAAGIGRLGERHTFLHRPGSHRTARRTFLARGNNLGAVSPNTKGATMSIKRYGVEGGKGTGGQHLPFARAVEAGGWLYVSARFHGQRRTGAGNITVQAHQAIRIFSPS